MAEIIRGTTPTITYTFSEVSVSDITSAILTFTSNGTSLTKELADATIGSTSLSWKLTQEETLSLSGMSHVMLNWLLSDNTRGATKPSVVVFLSNAVDEVMS